MTKLNWADLDNRRYESGVDRGVFYPLNGPGKVWNGLVSVNESPSDSNNKSRYLDGVKIGNRQTKGEFSATVEAFTYPTTFSDGMITPQRRTMFGLSYRVTSGDTYKIHLVYNALASPSERNYVYNSVKPFSWLITTRGIPVPEARPSAHLVIDSATAYPETMAALEDILYGSDSAEARLPMPDEVMQLFEDHSILQIIDHGDGTWTAIAPDNILTMINPTTFQISWPSAISTGPDSYELSSL